MRTRRLKRSGKLCALIGTAILLSATTLFHLYLGGSPPPAPFPNAGFDPTPDPLRCRAP